MRRTFLCAPKGIRTPVAGLKGLCPRPLDDGGAHINCRVEYISRCGNGQVSCTLLCYTNFHNQILERRKGVAERIVVACVQQRMHLPLTLDEYREDLRR